MSNHSTPVVQPKVDPETLALRTRPRRAIRFKREVIIGITALGSLGLVGVTWLALKPISFKHVAGQQELSQPAFSGPVDALNALPRSYGDVPRLGPPLPGDLGRPILDRQRERAFENAPGSPYSLAQAEAARRERDLTEIDAARRSSLLFQERQSGPAAAATPVDGVSVTQVTQAAASPDRAVNLDQDPNAQGHKLAFVDDRNSAGSLNSHTLEKQPSPYLLSAGSVIAASLITGLRSDLPGLVVAQVTEQVFDSPTGRILLVPQGARLIGSYDSVVAFGQKRALLIWKRIIMPDGGSISIDNMPATDPSGYAGLEDKVDFHTWSLLKGVAIATLLGVGAELQFSGGNDLVDALRQSTQQNVSHAGDQLTSRNLQVQPTITVRPGASVRLIVQQDLVLAPWRGGGS